MPLDHRDHVPFYTKAIFDCNKIFLGTVWTQRIITLIFEEDFPELKDTITVKRMPWLEYMLKKWKSYDTRPSPRLFCSHLLENLMPRGLLKKKAKVYSVVVVTLFLGIRPWVCGICQSPQRISSMLVSLGIIMCVAPVRAGSGPGVVGQCRPNHIYFTVEHKSCCHILDTLQRLDCRGRKSSQEHVAVVEAGDDERLDQELCCFPREEGPDPADSSGSQAKTCPILSHDSRSMVLRTETDNRQIIGDEILPQVEEFKYLGVLFTSEGRMEREINRRIGAASAVMRTLHGSVVVKRELSRKAKLSIYQSIFVPALTYGHELWVVTERTRLRVQVAEMSFLRRVAGLSLRDRVRSSVIREELGVDPLLLRVERSQMRWLGHLDRMPPGRLPGEVFRARPTVRRPRGRPRTRWRDYVSRLAWERFGIPQEELDEMAGEREVWASLLRLLPP
ncbi:putative uncharacterized transposon-derived protein F52C9.6 [Merluccius polli]|uniref:Sulfotransferase n=1 Tax=Merluccius polli TaxID=89951 RepID=A0AA47P7U5_MERPO|nr:putative uncharacterized transposon-derived protein F52C9.6 [Merluccius polli]